MICRPCQEWRDLELPMRTANVVRSNAMLSFRAASFAWLLIFCHAGCTPDGSGSVAVFPAEFCTWDAAFRAEDAAIAGKVIVAAGATVAAARLDVLPGGVLELAANSTLQGGTVRIRGGAQIVVSLSSTINATGDAVFEPGSSVDGTGRGYSPGKGPGSRPGNYSASHAGCSGSSDCIPLFSAGSADSPANASYGSFAAPVLPGSGGSGPVNTTGAGGAAFRLHVDGALTLNGSLTFSGRGSTAGPGANASAAFPSNGSSSSSSTNVLYPGSGGSIYISCGTLAPSNGSLIANGGNSSGTGGAAASCATSHSSAGRIAVACGKHHFRSSALQDITMRFSAANPRGDGAPGTIWLDLGPSLATGAPAARVLLVSGNGAGVSAQPALVFWPGSQSVLDLSDVQIILQNGGSLRFVRDASLVSNVTANATVNPLLLTGDGTGTLEVDAGVALLLTGYSATVEAPSNSSSSLLLRNVSVSFLPGSVPVLNFSSVYLGASAAIRIVDGASHHAFAAIHVVVSASASIFVRNAEFKCTSLVVERGGRLISELTGTFNVSGDAVLAVGSLVDGIGRGHALEMGPGARLGGFPAAHAGCSGLGNCSAALVSSSSTTPLNLSYGNFLAPVHPGSGGSTQPGTIPDGNGPGGAAVRLHAAGLLTMNGTIDVSAPFVNGFTGAGGSIFVSCGTLAASNGTLIAEGGRSNFVYGGSAGRIAVTCGRHSFRSPALADVTLRFVASGGLTGSTVPAGSMRGAAGSIYLSFMSSALGSYGRINALLAGSAGAQPTVVMADGLVRLDTLRLNSGGTLQLSPSSPNNSSLSLSVASLETTGSSPPQLVLAANTSLFVTGQRLEANGTKGSLRPSNVSIIQGAERVTAVFYSDTILFSAQTVLSEPGCSSPDTCSSAKVALRITGFGLYAVCAFGSVAQTWTTAQLSRIIACTEDVIEAVYDISADPGPWFYYQANISLMVPQPAGADPLPSNPVPVRQAPPAAPPSLYGPLTVNWTSAFDVNGTLLGAAIRSPGALVFAQDTGGRRPLPVAIMPLLSNASAAHLQRLQLRFVTSDWLSFAAPASPAAASGAASARLWHVRLTVQTTRPVGRADAGAVYTFTLLASVSVPVVAPVRSQLPRLIARSGGLFAAGIAELPSPPWSPAEAAGVCRATDCSLAVGPFSVEFRALGFPCPSDSSSPVLPQLAYPAGHSAALSVTLILCDGLLNISLGSVSYAPAGVLAAWPSAINLPSPAAQASVSFNWLLAASDDVASHAAFTVGGALCSGVHSVSQWDLPEDAPTWLLLAAANASATVRCSVLTSELGAAVPDADGNALMSTAVVWDNEPVPLSMRITVVKKPLLLKLSPPVLTPGGVCVIEGSNFCKGDPGEQCFVYSPATPLQLWFNIPSASLDDGADPAGSGNSSGTPQRVACGNMKIITDVVATCVPPALSPALPGYPTFTVTLANDGLAEADTHLTATFPSSSGLVQVPLHLPALPSRFLPSDASAPWLLPTEVVVEAQLTGNRGLFTGKLVCSLAPVTPGILLVPEMEGRQLTSVTGVGNVSFGRIAVQVPFSAGTIILSVSCTAPDASDVNNLAPLTWTLQPYPLTLTLCDPLPTAVESSQVLPPFTLAAVLRAGSGNNNSAFGGGSGALDVSLSSAALARPLECASNRSFAAASGGLALPPISCTVSAQSTGGSSVSPAVLQGNFVDMDALSGIATFSAFSLGGTTGATYSLRMRCQIGSIVLLGTPSASTFVIGCSAGSESVRSVCVPCGSGRWSAGGDDDCHTCPPRGAMCDGGILTLLPGFYRPPARRGEQLNASAILYECPQPERCLVVNAAAAASGGAANSATNSTASGRRSVAMHVCSVGATGPLCALCDVDGGYANIGGSCEPCPAVPINKSIVALVALLAVGAIAYMVLRKPADDVSQQSTADASISLRILLTHVQALAALRAFRASGLAIFRAATTWTDALTPAVFSEGPSSCVLKPAFVSTFLATLAAPVVASGVGLIILFAAAAARGKPSAAAHRKRGAAAVAATGSIPNRSVSSDSGYSCRAISARLRAVWRGREAERVLVLVLSLAYMSVVSACISVLDCSEEIDGVRYLRADYRVECRGGSYLALAALAVVALVAVGVGFPLIIFVRLRRATKPALAQRRFHAWTFMFAGYRVPDADADAKAGAKADAEEAAIASGISSKSLTMAATSGNPPALLHGAALPGGGTLNPLARLQLATPAAGSRNKLSTEDSMSAALEKQQPETGAISTTAAQAVVSRRRAAGAEDTGKLTGEQRCLCLTWKRQQPLSSTSALQQSANGSLRRPKSLACSARTHRVRSAIAVAPGSRAFWESTVLVRKMATVLLARLVEQALVQASLFSALMFLFLLAHALAQPYRERRFARAEGMSLLCLALTASLAISGQPAAGPSPALLAVLNWLIVLLNAATLAMLLWTWLRVCCPRYAAAANTAVKVVRQRLPGKGRHTPISRGSVSSAVRWISPSTPSGAGAKISGGTAIASSDTAAGLQPPRLHVLVAASGAAATGSQPLRRRQLLRGLSSATAAATSAAASGLSSQSAGAVSIERARAALGAHAFEPTLAGQGGSSAPLVGYHADIPAAAISISPTGEVCSLPLLQVRAIPVPQLERVRSDGAADSASTTESAETRPLYTSLPFSGAITSASAGARRFAAPCIDSRVSNAELQSSADSDNSDTACADPSRVAFVNAAADTMELSLAASTRIGFAGSTTRPPRASLAPAAVDSATAAVNSATAAVNSATAVAASGAAALL